MPELPEVEYAAAVARRVAVGRTITSAKVLHRSLRRALPARNARSLVGDRVDGIERRGKTQFFRLMSGRALAVHFRMTGDWHVSADGEPLPRHARAYLGFEGGLRLVLDDPRALSVLSLCAPGQGAADHLGPDADDPAFEPVSLAAALRTRRAPIKIALLDQRVVAGLGNIYTVEALWQARLNPRTPAHQLAVARLRQLVRAIRRVLAKAARNAERYYGAGASSPSRFAVYDREGKPCRRCGASIARMVQGGRSTYFCPRCQR